MTLTLKFLDVGLGTSVIMETDELNIIFDCGQDANGRNAFKELGFKTLDYLIITHPHKDHIESLTSPYYQKPRRLTRNKSIPEPLIEEQISKAKTDYDKEIFKKYKMLNRDFKYSVEDADSYTNPNNNGNVIIHHYTPSLTSINDLNYYSLATFLSYDGYKILLMGDNTLSNINELLSDEDFKSRTKDIDVLLAPHHGRASCYSQKLLEHLKPKITIISDKPEDNEESAREGYTYYSKGMYILEKGELKFRKCLTTRNDGDIIVLIKNNDISIIC